MLVLPTAVSTVIMGSESAVAKPNKLKRKAKWLAGIEIDHASNILAAPNQGEVANHEKQKIPIEVKCAEIIAVACPQIA